MSEPRVLIVEDEPDQAAILEAVLRHEGFDVVVASSGEHALEIHARIPANVAIVDLHLPGMSGIDFVRRVSQQENSESLDRKQLTPAIVIITGYGTMGSAVEVLKLGAADYLTKPLDPARLVSLVRELSLSSAREADDENDAPDGSLVFEGMIGGSRKMREVFVRIDRVAGTNAPVLVVGESGTGKELVARAIHNRSRRRHGPLVPVYTGAVPRELIGSELFGHEKGSFNGAFAAAEGKFEAASGGTIFLDEVGTMDPAVQISLRRVLETYKFTRVGGRKEIEADVRIVASASADILARVDAGLFREDLYYRLNVFKIVLPPLRERAEDIMPMAERFLAKYARRYGTPVRRFSDGACDLLTIHAWPGNVRELRNVMEQIAVYAPSETVSADELQSFGVIERRQRHARVKVSYSGEASKKVELPLRAGSQPGLTSSSSWSPNKQASTSPVPTPQEGFDLDLSREDAKVSPKDTSPLVLRLPVGTRLMDAERKLILFTLETVRGNKARAARLLGIMRARLCSKLDAYENAAPSVSSLDEDAPASPALLERTDTASSTECAPNTANDASPFVLRLPLGTRLEDAERRLILLTLETMRGDKTRAARVLGISPAQLDSKLCTYGENAE